MIGGFAVLALWARSDHAREMEARISSAAAGIKSVHEIKTAVSGRDITVSGLADSEAERDEIVKTLNAVDGRRIVNNELKVLERADPYRFSGRKPADGSTVFEGNIPFARAKQEFNRLLGATGTKFTLAAGMPDGGWPEFVGMGASALDLLREGELSVAGKSLTLKGAIADASGEAAVRKALATLPDGYSAEIDLDVLDDGKPASVAIVYDAASGATLSGKAPAGLAPKDLASALGLRALEGEVAASTQPGVEAIKSSLAGLGPWLAFFESLKATAKADGITVEGALGKGADRELIAKQLKEKLGDKARITLTEAQHSGTEGLERQNAATGQRQVLRSGYWLPLREFAISRDACEANTTGILKDATINFVTGSDRLGPRAVRVINSLAATLSHCLTDPSLSVEVGGHTDSQGNDAANLYLSNRRAAAVVAALAARGVPEWSMQAKGYGETSPVADNETAEGRAKNRRTTFIWSQN
ncbi:MAG: OmpA family protein [Pseudomonadota bacterium]